MNTKRPQEELDALQHYLSNARIAFRQLEDQLSEISKRSTQVITTMRELRSQLEKPTADRPGQP